MDRAKKAKLVQLRKKRLEAKNQSETLKHSELIEAVKSLHQLFSDRNINDSQSTEKLLEALSGLKSLEEEVAAVKQAIENIPVVEDVKVNNLSELIKSQKDFDQTGVINAIKTLTIAVKNQSVDSVSITNKKPEDFIPTRRVREVQGRLVYDDDPLQVTVVGGGGGGTIAAVQPDLLRDTADGKAIAIVNPDGTNISGGGGGGSGDASAANQDEQTAVLEEIRDNQLADGHNVTVDNLPTEYPLPAAQVTTLTPQTNALTDAQLRASDVAVDTGLTQPTTPSDTQPISATSLPLPAGAATAAKQDDIITAIGGIGGSTKYRTKIDEASSTVTYIGKAVLTGSSVPTASAVWQITKIDETSGTDITYADGDLSFNNIWDNRGSLSYA